MLDETDFDFSYHFDDDVMYITHLMLSTEHRRNKFGSFILETLFRVGYYEGADVVEVNIGGGESSEKFLKENGFHIIKRREYGENMPDCIEGKYGIDAVRKIPNQ